MSTRPGFPWLRWFPRDFASSTRTWPLIAKGIYRELLDAQWDVGSLPEDSALLRELVRATPAQWRVAWPFIEPKFPKVPGGRCNARLEVHRATAIREYESRRSGAATTNSKRWGGRKNGSLSDSVSDQ